MHINEKLTEDAWMGFQQCLIASSAPDQSDMPAGSTAARHLKGAATWIAGQGSSG